MNDFKLQGLNVLIWRLNQIESNATKIIDEIEQGIIHPGLIYYSLRDKNENDMDSLIKIKNILGESYWDIEKLIKEKIKEITEATVDALLKEKNEILKELENTGIVRKDS